MKWVEVVQRFAEDRPAKGGGICHYHLKTHYRDVVKVDGTTTYYFHDLPIAIKHSDGLTITHCGYRTYTTAIRLNAIIKQFFPEYTVYRLFCGFYVYMVLDTGENMYNFYRITLDKRGKVIGGDYSKIKIIKRIGRKQINDFEDYITVRTWKDTYVYDKKERTWYKVIGGKYPRYLCEELKNFSISIIS